MALIASTSPARGPYIIRLAAWTASEGSGAGIAFGATLLTISLTGCEETALLIDFESGGVILAAKSLMNSRREDGTWGVVASAGAAGEARGMGTSPSKNLLL